MNPPIDWLLDGEAFVVYRVRRDLLGQADGDDLTAAARRAMLASPAVQRLVTELSAWPGTVIASHKSAGQLFHKLTFAADLGLRQDDPGMKAVTARVMAQTAEEGPFQLPVNIPTSYGGDGQTRWAWALCDAPLTLYALAGLGLQDHPALRAAAWHLLGLARQNGWPCVVSKELGKFRGPGRKDDPCPFATLAMLKALAVLDEFQADPAARLGAEALLALWSESQTRHPYMFFMGSDFRKLKVPLVWYDLVHVLDVLSRFEWLADDPRLLDMANVLRGKMDPQGRFSLESVWTVWKDWEFGQKKAPSRWLTLLAWRILQRIDGLQAN